MASMDVRRRAFIGLVASSPVLFGAAGGDAHVQTAGASRRRAGSAPVLGTCLEMHHLESDPVLAGIAGARCDEITPEYSLQWSSFEPTAGTCRTRPVDRLVAFARARGQTVHGHALLWEQGTPGWGTPDWVKARLADDPDWRLIRRRFETVLTRYGTAIRSWTVVNEAIETGNRPDGLRANVFLRAFGPGYIAAAFETAAEFAPAARLMLNEYGLEYDNPVDRARRLAALKLVESLRRRGRRIDAFGIQGHLDLAKGRLDRRGLAAFLADLAGLGVEIRVTELDVRERDLAAPVAERDARVADETARFLDIVLDEPAVTGVTTWGLSDRFSWLRGDYDAIRAEPGSLAEVNRGLPYDVACAPKPMAAVLARALDSRIAAL
jgi:endo-1,4-beta-xylanase